MTILEITLGRDKQLPIPVDVPDDFNLLDAICNQGITGLYGTAVSAVTVPRTFYLAGNGEEVASATFIKTVLDNSQDNVWHLMELVA